jgi:hypothetical protein
MAKRYDVRFILCEDIRVEANGKVSMAGIYPGELIVLLQNIAEAALPAGTIAVLSRLCFVFFVSGPPGSVAASINVYSPNRDQKVIESKPLPGKIEQGRTGTIGFTGSTFPVPALGSYAVELKLDEELHEFGFVVEAGPDFVPRMKPMTRRRKSQPVKPASRRAKSSASRAS